MKTLLLENSDGDKVLIKVDIFGTNANLQDPTFDTRFTAMDIDDENLAISKGLNFSQVEYSYRSIVKMAIDKGWSLQVADLNQAGGIVQLYDGLIPTIPLNLLSSSITATTVDLAWDPSSDNVAVVGYKVYQDDVEIDEVEVASVSVTGLTTATTYAFKVAAFDAQGNLSAKSVLESVTTA